MNHYIKQLAMVTGTVLTLCGCGNFLEQRSQNMAYLEKVEDLDELLLGECYWSKAKSFNENDACQFANLGRVVGTGTAVGGDWFPFIHVMDDDAEEYIFVAPTRAEGINTPRLKMSQFHYWQKDPFRDSELKELEDVHWNKVYRRISVLNSILHEVDNFRTENEQNNAVCDRIKGEALFLRAHNYFWLANLYGRPYCKATAGTDVCIPLKTTEAIEDHFFSRSPMEDVYGQIRTDLLRAIESFQGGDNKRVYRANRAGAFALLSRVCLYMERYEDAASYADSVLNDSRYHLLDYNARKDEKSSVVYASSSETIFTQGPSTIAGVHCPSITNEGCFGYTSSEDLLNCYEENDLRRKAFFVEREPFKRGTVLYYPQGERCVKWREASDDEEVSDCMALRLPEVYLNKAEALALAGRDGEAVAAIEKLLEVRYSEMPAFAQSGEELVKFIREERRRELCFEGHRWFDLRRYAVNTEYPQSKQIEHFSIIYEGNEGPREGRKQGRYVLKPYNEDAAAYILPIPRKEIDFNTGTLSNEERNERPML